MLLTLEARQELGVECSNRLAVSIFLDTVG